MTIQLIYINLGPIPLYNCCHKAKSMEISFCHYPNSITMFATKFCIWHGSYTVAAYGQICSDLPAWYGIPQNDFSSNLNLSENSLVKCAPGQGLGAYPSDLIGWRTCLKSVHECTGTTSDGNAAQKLTAFDVYIYIIRSLTPLISLL